MVTFALIHGAGDSGWYWHLVAAELRRRGHHVVAPDLPDDDDSTLPAHADAVIEAIGGADHVVVVGQSFGAFVACLVADRIPVDALVLVAGMVPAPGEPPDDWWANTGYAAAVQGARGGEADEFTTFFHDVPRPLAEEAIRRGRSGSLSDLGEPYPLDAWPGVPTRFVLCTQDRFFPPEFLRGVVAERLDVRPDEISAGHCVALSRPAELAALLDSYARVPDR